MPAAAILALCLGLLLMQSACSSSSASTRQQQQQPLPLIAAATAQRYAWDRHGIILEPRDYIYEATTLDRVWSANVKSWLPNRGELWDCEDQVNAMIVQLNRDAYARGTDRPVAAFALPVRAADGMPHMITLLHDVTGWKYWAADHIRQLSPSEFLPFHLTNP